MGGASEDARRTAAGDRPTPADARALWRVCEPVHAVTYFAPEVRDALKAVGLRGFWMGYTAARLAPLGPIGPEVGTAVLHNFAPTMVARSLPDAWRYASPEAVLTARAEALPRALAPFVEDLDVGTIEAVTASIRRATEAAGVEGRAMFAAHVALPWPDDPVLRLWHATTLLREHRGDGHVAALTAADLTGLEAHVLATAVRGGDPAVLRDNRGWSEDEWARSVNALATRGLVDRTGAATAVGQEEHAAVEAVTDRLAARPLARLDRDDVATLIATLAPVAQRIAATGLVPFPNPMGLPRP
ncbi:SCO6745 family protein [Nitriliruptor alkaliphilus]|uniref:SCO6745 family protein n=1 Tax=Nitriliruptor alkaliphilus TaxID=427918 RepID=UPI000AFB2E57|nr:hypothetical protein [Nitriliruptor alkaliphilus]